MYNRTFWRDHALATPNEFTVEQVKDNIYSIKQAGEVLQKGTLLSAENHNKVELALFESIVTLGSLFQNLQLLKDDIEASKKELEKVVFFETEEHSVGVDSFTPSDAAYVATKTFTFSDDKIRNNINYIVIPVITDFDLKTNKEGCNNYIMQPVLTVSEKRTNGFDLDFSRFDINSVVKTYYYKCIVIGGV